MARTLGAAAPIPIRREDPPAVEQRLRAMVRSTLETTLGPTLDTYRAIRLTVDDRTLDDAAVGRRVRQIMAEAQR